MKKADKKQPTTSAGPSAGPSTQDTAPPADKSREVPTLALNDFKFPADDIGGNPAGVADATGALVNTAGDTLMSLPVSDVVDQATEATAGSTKTKSSKRERAKKLQKRVVLKIRDLGGRLKKHLQNGKKKMKPKTPALKLKVELDNPVQQAGDPAKGLAFAAPAA